MILQIRLHFGDAFALMLHVLNFILTVAGFSTSFSQEEVGDLFPQAFLAAVSITRHTPRPLFEILYIPMLKVADTNLDFPRKGAATQSL